MSITLEQAQTALNGWVSADLAISKGQSYSMNGRTITLANIKEVREQIQYWERRINALQNPNTSIAYASFE